MISITLKDGSVLSIDNPTDCLGVAEKISPGLARAALAAKVDGAVCDLSRIIDKDVLLEILTFDSDEGRRAYWHTTSHILAQAVKRLYPDVKLAIGTSIDNGFYYDFDTEEPFTAEALDRISGEMKKIIKEDHKIERFTMTRGEALAFLKNEPYKTELVSELPEGETISFYRQGEFTDLCAGPHLPSTGRVKAFALTSSTGAYWRGDSSKKMLKRIYGTAFPKQSMLDEYLAAVEEAKKRDHNKIGRELEYFTTSEYIGQGLPILMPKGARVIQILQRFVEDEEQKRGYLLTKTPFFAKRELYKISGHWDHYREGMFIMGDPESEDEVFALRPMTCPFQFQAYLSRMRSYRDLPLRYNETSTLFRNEASGEMHGLIRLRQFTISEGHIACTPEQLEKEFFDALDLARFMLKTLGLDEDVTYRFSKWDENDREKYIGEPGQWEEVQTRMRDILDHTGIEYTEASGEAAFYGPKLDIQIKNVYGKEDTLITIQVDFLLAERFEMEYIDKDGSKKHPYVLHRTSIGCYERTLALLLEKYAGALPVWLMPTQVKVLPITDRQHDYARDIEARLLESGVRVETDLRSEKIGYKIREAQLEKIPYMLVVGDKEQESGEVAVRARQGGDIGTMKLEEFIKKVLQDIETKQ
ncbi:MAG: threonine--tRNA ligase [Clostridiales bacterium]|nr:threonine--tRNA ligase [Clostridiales bacterium]